MKSLKNPLVFPLRALGGFSSLLLLVCLLTACIKQVEPESKLPKETQEGKNTFGCYLNGQLWIPQKGMGPGHHVMCTIEPNGVFHLRAFYETDGRDEEIYLYSSNISGTGEYPIKKSLKHEAIFKNWKENTLIASYDSDTVEDGILTIKSFDMQKRIVAGNFWFKLKKENGLQVEATDGRFDIYAN